MLWVLKRTISMLKLMGEKIFTILHSKTCVYIDLHVSCYDNDYTPIHELSHDDTPKSFRTYKNVKVSGNPYLDTSFLFVCVDVLHPSPTIFQSCPEVFLCS